MKTVLITGGSRGIGKSMVELFSKSGYNVAFTYNKSEEYAIKLSAETGALAIKANSLVEDEVVFAVNKTVSSYGGIDVLINNAAVSSIGTLRDISLDEWNRVIGTSLTGAYLYSKHSISEMLKKKYGRIINISSMWGLTGASCEVHYSAAKAGVIGFTKALAKELGPSGITVNAIAPGVINTDMNKNLSEDDMALLREETPVMRIGSPIEVARCALFLADDESGFITGEVMNVSGGYVT